MPEKHAMQREEGAAPAKKRVRRRGGRGAGKQEALPARAESPSASSSAPPAAAAFAKISPASPSRPSSAGPSASSSSAGPSSTGGGRGRGRQQKKPASPGPTPVSPASPAVAAFASVSPASPSPSSTSTSSSSAASSSSSSSSAAAASSSSSTITTTALFSSLPVHANSHKALAEDFKYTNMTPVQELTLPHSLAHKDVLGQAKTGSGKTLAFLLPAVENALRSQGPRVTCLIISPTRELASQIQKEALRLVSHHRAANLAVVCLFGGVSIEKDRRQLAAAKNTSLLLVGTPGRLNDHLENTPGFSASLGRIQTLVLDEFDQLLDMGFRPDILRIVSHCPAPASRQTLLFSATLPASLVATARSVLRPDYVSIAAKSQAEQAAGTSEDTVNVDIAQALVGCELSELFPLLYALVQEHKAACRDYKVMVFFTTARLTQWAAALFQKAALPVLEIHSRKSQAFRTSTSQKFREGSRMVLFSSDVSARGMDYPNVSLVVQVGLPASREQYIHRIGRTARGGLTGQSLVILARFEIPAFFKFKVPGLDKVDKNERDLEPARQVLQRAAASIPNELSGSAYQSFLGFYNSYSFKILPLTKPELVATTNRFAFESMFLTAQPKLLRKTVGKMGLKGVPGLLVE